MSVLHSISRDGKWLLFTNKSTLAYAYLYQRSDYRRVGMETWGVWIIIKSHYFSSIYQQTSTYCCKIYGWKSSYCTCRGGAVCWVRTFGMLLWYVGCIFPYPLQCLKHKDIMWCLVPSSLCFHSNRHQDAWEPLSCVAIAVLSANEISWPAPETGHTHSYNCVHMLSLAEVHAMPACV